MKVVAIVPDTVLINCRADVQNLVYRSQSLFNIKWQVNNILYFILWKSLAIYDSLCSAFTKKQQNFMMVIR